MSLHLFRLVYDLKDSVALISRKQSAEDVDRLFSLINKKLLLVRQYIDDIDGTSEDLRW